MTFMYKSEIKVIFWIFGTIFTGIIYYLIMNVSFLSYIKEIHLLPLIIVLILLIFFFLIGIFSSKIPIFWYSIFKKKDLKESLTKIELKRKEEEVNRLVKKLKKSIDALSKKEYSEASINYFIKNIGLTEEHAKQIIKNIRQLRRLKTLSVFLGLFLSVILYFIVTNLDIFSHIPKIIVLISSIVIFLLFILEGFLITRMPIEFYLNLINLNKETLLNTQKEFSSKSDLLKEFDSKQKNLLDNIKNATKFLLTQNVDKKSIFNYFKKFDVNEETINNFIKISENEILKENESKNILNSESNAIIKLTLSQIQENFQKINEIYQKVSSLQKEVSEISERQKKLETLPKIDVSKEIKNIGKTKFKNLKQFSSKKINSVEDEEYEKLISYIYHLFLPQVNTFSQNDLFSTLVYSGYPYEVIEDVISRFKKKGVVFGKDKKYSFSERIINKINNFYDYFSK